MTASIILTHQSPACVRVMCDYWQALIPGSMLLVAYGGSRADYERLDVRHKVFVDDERLRTVDHQREYQSYTGVFKQADEYLSRADYEHVYFTEFDHIPLRHDLLDLLQSEMVGQGADVLIRSLQRLDGTGHAHYLYHLGTKGFSEKLDAISLRDDSSVVLSGFGFGQLWTREAFSAVASINQDVPCYLEIWLPTVAHHLGFRVKGWDVFQEYHGVDGDRVHDLISAVEHGAWALHPVKSVWLNPSLPQTIIGKIRERNTAVE